MILKLKLSFLLLVTTVFTANSAKITGVLDAYHIGNWGMKQHNSICDLIYKSILKNKVKTLNLSKEGALELLSTYYPVFLSTDPNDPSVGKDTLIQAPLNFEFVQFICSKKTEFWFKPTLEKQAIQLDGTIYTLLNAEQKSYLDMFAINGDIRYSDIPKTSFSILKSLNVKLHNEGKKPATLLYKNDSFTSTYSQKLKAVRGSQQVVAFISTDKFDPTIGYDSTFIIPYEDVVSDTSKYQSLQFTLNQTGTTYTITGLSSAFTMDSYYSDLLYSEPYGFIKYPMILGLSIKEKTFLNYAIASSIDSRVKMNDESMEYYLKNFNIKKARTTKQKTMQFNPNDILNSPYGW